MSGDAAITLIWAGEERRFRLAIGQLRELQELVNSRRTQPIGPWSLLQLVIARDAWPDDLRDIIRLGLIGGGTKSELIPGLVKRYVEEMPLVASCLPAALILSAALTGVPDDPVGKKPPAEETTDSNFQDSTAAAPSLDSLLNTSTSVHSGNSRHVSKDTTGRTPPTNQNPTR